MSQLDLFCQAAPGAPETTALYPNRMRDKAQVERLLGLPEFPLFPGETFEFFTPAGTLFARQWVRVVYGDHGPYLEYAPAMVLCPLRPKFNRPLPPDAYYEWLVPVDGSDLKVYDQKRDVQALKNPPKGGFAGHRAEGYADYRPGMIYVSPWDLTIRQVPRQS